MRIFIENKDDVYTADFIKFSVRWIRTYGVASIDRSKLIKATDYLNSIFDIMPEISAYHLVVTGFGNLLYRKVRDGFIIEINTNLKYRSTNARLESLCNLIDQGNLDLEPYPIFTDTFQYYCDNLKEVYEIYKLSRG